jgi:hypothetical protein
MKGGGKYFSFLMTKHQPPRFFLIASSEKERNKERKIGAVPASWSRRGVCGVWCVCGQQALRLSVEAEGGRGVE